MAPLAGLNYKSCRVEELKVFVEKRTGKKPPKSSKKQRLLDTLQQLDDAPAVFRFLDLPAEMRNLIYGHLLNLYSGNKGKMCCSTAILRCSKQTRDEAHGILYGHNVPSIDIKIFHRPSGTTFPGAQVREYSFLGVKVTHSGFERSQRRISAIFSSWPAELLRFHGIDVNFVVDAQNSTDKVDAPEHLRVALNHTLYSICTFLASSGALKTVNVSLKLDNGEPPDDEELRQILWPVTRLGRVSKQKLEGVPTDIEQYVRANEPKDLTVTPIDVLGKAFRLCKKSQHLKTLMNDVMQRNHKDRVIARSYEIHEALKSTRYITEHDEEALKQQIRKLEEMFADPVFTQIKAKADAYIARVQATRDGAFEEA